ncbi:MAG: putative DNA binding domain-containing protein [Simkaniaceae bacterium]|nr:putative DNA binding domain-containing protein [Simkaniaceae bacterium]
MVSSRNSIRLNEIRSQLLLEEGEDIEFKSAKGGLPKSLWETYSAMANSFGGMILLGVENDGQISGVSKIDQIKKDFWNTINNRGKVSVNLLSQEHLRVIETAKGLILSIHIPRAKYFQKPIFIGQNPFLGTYRRNFDGDYHCTQQEIIHMLADRSEYSADQRIIPYATINDLDLASIRQYRQRFASHKPTHPWLEEDDKKFLSKLGAYRYSRETEQEGVTIAGLLMYGQEQILKEAIPQYQVDFREKLSNDPHVRWTDRLTLDGTWSGNLYQFYIRVIQKLNADLKIPFQLDAELFRRGESGVHIAIREALVNALIHADYSGQGGIIIEKYPDRFELSNPGALLISIDQLWRGNVSECRNKALQTMFMMIGAAEKAGSGVDKICKGWESQHWRKPIMREQVQPDRILWILPMISLIPDTSLIRLKNIYRSEFEQFQPLEIQALVTADVEGYVDNMRMCEITGKHTADMTRLLQDLVSRGLLRQNGKGRWTRYSIPSQFHSVHLDSDSVHLDPDSVHLDPDSVHLDPDSVHLEEEEMYIIAQTAREMKKLFSEDMEQMILKLCKGRWINRKQLGNILQRNPDALRSRFLTSMVRKDLLRLRYPDKPNRVDQAYTIASEGIAKLKEVIPK